MNKKIVVVLIVVLLIITAFVILFHRKKPSITANPSESKKVVETNSVLYNGNLHTNGANLENEHGEIIQLRGVSSHGIEWFSNVITYDNLKSLKEDWKINVFRVAMYTDSSGSGYIHNPDSNLDKVCKIIDMAIDLDMYVIVDWHILDDNNPQTYQNESKEFFNAISKKYADVPNIIYEICNEPNGNDVTWNDNIKPYAENVIPVIRQNSKKALIIVGTPNWSKQIDEPANNPLNFENIVYACHFYSGSHGKSLQDKISNCISKGIPIFVSECGLTDASGRGTMYIGEFMDWISFLNSHNISWVYWSFSNKNESSAILDPSYIINDDSEYIDFNNYLTESGKQIKNILSKY